MGVPRWVLLRRDFTILRGVPGRLLLPVPRQCGGIALSIGFLLRWRERRMHRVPRWVRVQVISADPARGDASINIFRTGTRQQPRGLSGHSSHRSYVVETFAHMSEAPRVRNN